MMRRLLLAVIRGYQLLFSSFFGRSCRFYPTCSTYAAQSIARFGVLRGSGLALWRLARCHPLHPGGHDPVPAQLPRWRACCKTGSDSGAACATHQPHVPSTSRPQPGADQ